MHLYMLGGGRGLSLHVAYYTAYHENKTFMVIFLFKQLLLFAKLPLG